MREGPHGDLRWIDVDGDDGPARSSTGPVRARPRGPRTARPLGGGGRWNIRPVRERVDRRLTPARRKHDYVAAASRRTSRWPKPSGGQATYTASGVGGRLRERIACARSQLRSRVPSVPLPRDARHLTRSPPARARRGAYARFRAGCARRRRPTRPRWGICGSFRPSSPGRRPEEQSVGVGNPPPATARMPTVVPSTSSICSSRAPSSAVRRLCHDTRAFRGPSRRPRGHGQRVPGRHRSLPHSRQGRTAGGPTLEGRCVDRRASPRATRDGTAILVLGISGGCW